MGESDGLQLDPVQNYRGALAFTKHRPRLGQARAVRPGACFPGRSNVREQLRCGRHPCIATRALFEKLSDALVKARAAMTWPDPLQTGQGSIPSLAGSLRFRGAHGRRFRGAHVLPGGAIAACTGGRHRREPEHELHSACHDGPYANRSRDQNDKKMVAITWPGISGRGGRCGWRSCGRCRRRGGDRG